MPDIMPLVVNLDGERWAGPLVDGDKYPMDTINHWWGLWGDWESIRISEDFVPPAMEDESIKYMKGDGGGRYYRQWSINEYELTETRNRTWT